MSSPLQSDHPHWLPSDGSEIDDENSTHSSAMSIRSITAKSIPANATPASIRDDAADVDPPAAGPSDEVVVLPDGLVDEGMATSDEEIDTATMKILSIPTTKRVNRSTARALRAVQAAKSATKYLKVKKEKTDNTIPSSLQVKIKKEKTDDSIPSSSSKAAKASRTSKQKGTARGHTHMMYSMEYPPVYPWIEMPRPIDVSMMMYVWANDPKPWESVSLHYWKACSQHLFKSKALGLNKVPRARGLAERFEYLMVFVDYYIQDQDHRTGGNESYPDYLKKLTEIRELRHLFSSKKNNTVEQQQEEKRVIENMLDRMLGKRPPILICSSSKGKAKKGGNSGNSAQSSDDSSKKKASKKTRTSVHDVKEEHKQTLLLATALEKAQEKICERIDKKKKRSNPPPIKVVDINCIAATTSPGTAATDCNSLTSSATLPLLHALHQQQELLQDMKHKQQQQHERAEQHHHEVFAQQASIATSLKELVGILGKQQSNGTQSP